MQAAHGETNIWAKTLDVARRHWIACLGYVGMMMAVGFAEDFMSSSSVSMWVQAAAAVMLAVPAHLSVLRNEQQQRSMATTDNTIFWRFFLRSFLLGAIALVPAIIAVIVPVSMDASLEQSMLILLAILGVMSIFVFARWGSMLPAAVLDTDTSFRAASRRASTTFGYAAGRLAMCFILLTIVMIGVAVLFAQLSPGDGKFIFNGRLDAAIISGTLLVNIIGAYQVVMTAVILSRAYLMAEPALAAGPGRSADANA